MVTYLSFSLIVIALILFGLGLYIFPSQWYVKAIYAFFTLIAAIGYLTFGSLILYGFILITSKGDIT
jgi:hypothetical protein